MKIYGLSGKSGTGKSYQALNVCREKNIECIIDDGLLIAGNKVIAGRSAKRQSTMIGAIKTALFTDVEHREEVVRAIKERVPKSVLVLGISDQMVTKIVKNLELPEIDEMLHIEDITNQKEREIAQIQRKQHGKHVIPVATFQLKHHFSGYFLNPVRILHRIWETDGAREMPERSVVRPTYSYLGGYVISEKVIADIITCVGTHRNSVRSIGKVIIVNRHEGIQIKADVFMDAYCSIPGEARLLQEEIARKVEYMTSFNILSVVLTVRGLVY